MELREIQKPLKDRYRTDPDASKITLRADGAKGEDAMSCSVDLGRLVQQAEAHTGVGGAGTAACSGDLLLGALAACAQLTCQMVAANMGIEVERIEAAVEGDLDLRGTLGVDREVAAGFTDIRLRFDIDAPRADPEQLGSLIEKTERYCTVLQTLRHPPPVEAGLAPAGSA
ncbi:MAG: OsmC family protein [Solirubrobacterales bacterium]